VGKIARRLKPVLEVNAQKRSWSRLVSCLPAAWRGSTGSGKQAAVGDVLRSKHEQDNIIGADRELYQHGITSSVEGVETDINASKTDEQLAEVKGK
jgi:hypothetical protein